jgi:hypothetical protein
MKHIILFESWIQLHSDYKGTTPRPGSRFYGGDEGEWKFVWNEHNNKKDISYELGVYPRISVYEIYQPQGLLDFCRGGKLFLKKGTDLSHALFSDEFIWEKDWRGGDLMPSKMSNNRPSTFEWNSRFNKMVSDIAANDVLIHDNHKDIFFISMLKDADWKRVEEIRSGSKKFVDSYIVGEPKPYNRKGKERKYFDKNGKEIQIEDNHADDAIHAEIARFMEKI